MVHRGRIWRLVAVVFSSVLILVSSNARDTAAQNLSDPDDAAVYYSELESRGRFSRLYRLMHPDAKRIIPREVVIGWYENEFAPRGPEVITVLNVTYGSWTWDVNGKTYQNAVAVTYTQPFEDGSVVEDTIHLVKRSGDWLWFFGPSREFVDQQIGIYSDSESSGRESDDDDEDGERSRTSDDALGVDEVVELLDAPFSVGVEVNGYGVGPTVVTEPNYGSSANVMFQFTTSIPDQAWWNTQHYLTYLIYESTRQAEDGYNAFVNDMISTYGNNALEFYDAGYSGTLLNGAMSVGDAQCTFLVGQVVVLGYAQGWHADQDANASACFIAGSGVVNLQQQGYTP